MNVSVSFSLLLKFLVQVLGLGITLYSQANSKVVLEKKASSGASILPLFPEEHFREKWDRGCADWKDLFVGLGSRENLAIQFERKDGTYTLWGQARVQTEAGESTEYLLDTLKEILSDSSSYKDWIFPGINEHPRKGSSYFVELHDLHIEAHQPTHIYLSGPFDFKVMSLKVRGVSTIELKWDASSHLSCMKPPSLEPMFSDAPVWRYRMFPRPDILEWMIGELTLFKRGEGRVDIQTRFVMKPSPLVYSLLPSKVMESELRHRAQRVFQNVIEIRRKRVWDSGRASRVGYPSETRGQSPKSESSR
jgi:hypothetical protein